MPRCDQPANNPKSAEKLTIQTGLAYQRLIPNKKTRKLKMQLSKAAVTGYTRLNQLRCGLLFLLRPEKVIAGLF
jgi:hypothetical protein